MRVSQFIREGRWVFLRRWFEPKKPLFHGTTGPRVFQIVARGFLSDTESRHDQPAQVGVSTSRNLDFMLQGHFGNYIFVLDEIELSHRFRLVPVRYPRWPDEYETRIITQRVPPGYIRGLIINRSVGREIEELREVPFPVVYRRKGRWTSVDENEE